MQGDLDLQISKAHFNEYKNLLKDKDKVVFKEYEKLNHLFTNGENETIENAYMKNASVDNNVILDIVSFINNY